MTAQALLLTFADPARNLHGWLRAGMTDEHASVIAVVFHGHDVALGATAGALEPSGTPWDEWSAGPLAVRRDDAGIAIALRTDDGTLAIHAAPVGEPGELDPSGPLPAALGARVTERMVRVRGTLEPTGDRTHELDALGVLGEQTGAVAWDRLAATRTVHAWTGAHRWMSLAGARVDGADGHDEDAIGALLAEDSPVAEVLEPRLSTTFDDDGRPRRCSTELWPDEDSWARRATAEAVAGTTLPLGRLRLDLAVLEWRWEGVSGHGWYALARRGA